jgi:CheY-like chemotaxis protein
VSKSLRQDLEKGHLRYLRCGEFVSQLQSGTCPFRGDTLGSARFERTRPPVLIVEDTALVSIMIEELMPECGCEIAGIASSLKDARQAMARHNYDAVLLDVGLPGGKTFELADMLTERAVPFAFVTAYQDAPFSTATFTDTVRMLTGLSGPGSGTGQGRCRTVVQRIWRNGERVTVRRQVCG